MIGLVVILLAAVGFLIIQNYRVYDDTGKVHWELPFMQHKDGEDKDSAIDPDEVEIERKEPSAVRQSERRATPPANLVTRPWSRWPSGKNRSGDSHVLLPKAQYLWAGCRQTAPLRKPARFDTVDAGRAWVSESPWTHRNVDAAAYPNAAPAACREHLHLADAGPDNFPGASSGLNSEKNQKRRNRWARLLGIHLCGGCPSVVALGTRGKPKLSMGTGTWRLGVLVVNRVCLYWHVRLGCWLGRSVRTIVIAFAAGCRSGVRLNACPRPHEQRAPAGRARDSHGAELG